jgi:glycosyltransferase involved in cell wall biosynthesis
MDKANAAVAAYLAERQTPVHLVAHQVDRELAQQPGVTVHLVPRPAGSFLLGERLLDRQGRAVARGVSARWPGARVVVNGGCCTWPDVNWVHYVHHAWSPSSRAAPVWFRVKNRLSHAWARWRERAAIPAARLVLANSERTRRDVIAHLGVDPDRVRTVYLGTDPAWGPVEAAERAAARTRWGRPGDRPVVLFVGALGHDQRKGFATLWSAWQRLCARPEWDADLLVAGGGTGLARFRAQVARAGLAARVQLLGFTDEVCDLLAAADLLVSPVRYESYGLNVQEAICRGIPALVSAGAGVAERYPRELADLILPDPEDAADLAARLLRWRPQLDDWKERFRPLASRLRSYTWRDMARRIVALAEGNYGFDG